MTTLFSLGLFLKLESLAPKILAARQVLGAKSPNLTYFVPVNIPTPTLALTPTPAPTGTPIPTPLPAKTEQWGISKQVDQTTWTIKVKDDARMGQAEEILSALNNYRQKKGRGTLARDQKLADFAQARAQNFAQNGSLDGHAGFKSLFGDTQNLKNIGFMGLGENSSFGYNMEAVHLIEWVFAGDAPHEDNQLDPSWSHVGIGVSGTAVDLIFAKNKI